MSGPNGLSTAFGGSNIGAAQFADSPCSPPTCPPEATGPRAGVDQVATRLWLPSDLGSKLQLWLKGDDLSGSNGASITTWADATANANNAVGTTNKPTLVTSGLNGLNTVAFAAASSQCLFLPSTLLSGRTQSATFAVYKLAVDPPAAGTTRCGPVFGDFGTDVSGNHDPFQDGNFYDDYCSTTRRTVSGVSSSTAFRILGLRSKAADWRLDINGTNAFTDSTNTVGTNTAPTLGFTNDAGHFLDGQIAEVVDCNDFLLTSEKEQVEGYLAWKWGLQASLPVGHTYASAAPTSGASGTTYNETLGESAAAADGASSTQTFVNTLAESVAVSDSLTGGLLLAGSLNETSAAADALANAVTWGPAQTESAAANDSLASSATFGSALGETAATSDSLAAGNVIAATRAESAAAADTETAAQTFVSSLTETAASSDSLSAGLVIAKSLNETAAAADSATVAVTFNPALTESAAAGDAEASSQTMPNALGEGASAGDVEASKETFNVSLGESVGAGDSDSAGATTYNENIGEVAAAGDTEADAATMASAESESAAAADAATTSSTLAGAVGEQAGASDQASSAQAASAPLGETSGASDSAAAGVTYGVTVNENLAALASLGVGLVLPASVGETATAGDAETTRADLAASLDEQASANDDYEASVVAVITHQMAVLEAVKALVQAALPDMALGFTADSDKKVRAGQREIGQARGAVEIEYEFGSNAQIFRQPIGIVLTAPGGFGGLVLDDMDAAIGTAILADRTLGGLVDWIEASAATLASRSARGVASLNWATIVITAEYRTEGALAA